MITKSKPKSDTILPILVLLLFAAAIAAHYALEPWGFYRKVSEGEVALRMQVVQTAESYLGCRESDGSHEAIIDLYNAHEPLAQNYTVQYTGQLVRYLRQRRFHPLRPDGHHSHRMQL